jgi:hypothetical protein
VAEADSNDSDGLFLIIAVLALQCFIENLYKRLTAQAPVSGSRRARNSSRRVLL